jgi:hypothetical protein
LGGWRAARKASKWRTRGGAVMMGNGMGVLYSVLGFPFLLSLFLRGRCSCVEGMMDSVGDGNLEIRGNGKRVSFD